jgi:endonuclease YncB( thermonuclease family)
MSKATVLRLLTADNNTPLFSFDGVTAAAKVTDVHDGDTCKVVMNLPGTGTFKRFIVRLDSIDTPEISSKDDIEKQKAVQARNRLLEWVAPKEFSLTGEYSKQDIISKLRGNNQLVYLKLGPFDKYGRLLATLHRDPDLSDDSINTILVKDNLAKLYDGGTKDANWA